MTLVSAYRFIHSEPSQIGNDYSIHMSVLFVWVFLPFFYSKFTDLSLKLILARGSLIPIIKIGAG